MLPETVVYIHCPKEREGDLLNSHSKERLSCACRKINILVCLG